MKRSAGILMHISSLPGKRGIGSLGNAAYEFVDFAADAKLSLWQVLPLCTTSYGDSPYQSPSALAGNPYFIDLDTLAGDGLLRSTELPEYPAGDVDYARLFEERYATLKKAYRRFDKNLPDYVSFKAENASWLDDYALFLPKRCRPAPSFINFCSTSFSRSGRGSRRTPIPKAYT